MIACHAGLTAEPCQVSIPVHRRLRGWWFFEQAAIPRLPITSQSEVRGQQKALNPFVSWLDFTPKTLDVLYAIRATGL